MNVLKIRLCRRLGDEWLNEVLIAYIARDVFDGISTEAIFQRFQAMNNH